MNKVKYVCKCGLTMWIKTYSSWLLLVVQVIKWLAQQQKLLCPVSPWSSHQNFFFHFEKEVRKTKSCDYALKEL